MNEWDGKDRRENSNNVELLIYKVSEAEKKIDKLQEQFSNLNITVIESKAELKAELLYIAKNEGRVTGALWGIASAVIITIIGIIIKSSFEGK
jgi:tetrahydromethanopterin S-methyltransferase subunit G